MDKSDQSYAVGRPERVRITTELGQEKTPADGGSHYSKLGRGRDALILGLGPVPTDLFNIVPADRDIAYVECPDFEGQMPESWKGMIPLAWQKISPEDLTDERLRASTLYIYTPGVTLFPGFWGPILGRVSLRHARKHRDLPLLDYVLLSGNDEDLLVPEVGQAFAGMEIAVKRVNTTSLKRMLPQILRQGGPKLFLSINFKGLDTYGELFHMMHAAGMAVAVWCVDNPFHLLTGVKSPYWKDAHLLVTDETFVQPLKDLGAKHVMHMPLAARAELFERPEPEEVLPHALFVGRPHFPDADKYFSGVSVPPTLQSEAAALMDAAGDERPHFHWWMEKLGIETPWPGNAVRQAGYGAQIMSERHKRACIIQANNHIPLEVFGDVAWKEIVPGLKHSEGPVDYYTTLPDLYATRAVTINATGLLLPAGLNQRHFDVWASGGFLLTDKTPGLGLFPKELTEPITFSEAPDLRFLPKRFIEDEQARKDIRAAWRAHLQEKHTYAHRMQALLEWLEETMGSA